MLAITTTLVTTIFTAAQATTTSWAAPFASSKPQSFQLFVPLPPLTTAIAVVIVIAVTERPATVAPGAVAALPRPPAISSDQVASAALQALSFAFQGPFSSAPIRAGEALLLHLACHLPLLLR
jgi:hypothetical protein